MSLLVLTLACGPKTHKPLDTARREDTGRASESDTAAPFSLAGCTATMSVDVMKDGVLDWLWHYQYDEVGAVDAIDSDAGADGSLDARVDYVYLAGLLDQRLWDDGRDGILNSIDSYTYDAEDQLIEMVMDGGADGLPDAITTWAWSDGLERTESVDEDADGAPELRIAWSYQDRLKVLGEYDLGLDGVVDDTQHLFYEEGLLVRDTVDAGSDGTDDVVELTTYDTRGLVATVSKDMGNDGVIDAWSAWEYVCP